MAIIQTKPLSLTGGGGADGIFWILALLCLGLAWVGSLGRVVLAHLCTPSRLFLWCVHYGRSGLCWPNGGSVLQATC